MTDLVVTVVEQPLARRLAISLTRADSVEVRYSRDDGEGPTLSIRTLIDRVGTVTLARLAAGASYTVEVTPASGGSDPILVGRRFTTEPLPEELQRLQFVAEGTPTYPLAVLEMVRNEDGFEGVVIVDADGTIVWYDPEKSTGSTRRDNGNFVFGLSGQGLREVSADGSVVHELEHNQHHDVITTPQNTLYYVVTDIQPFQGEDVLGEAIWEWNPEEGTHTQRWSSWDHFSYETDKGGRSRASDWLHANSLSIGPTGNLLMSFRFLNQVVSITPDFADIEWRLGGVNATILTGEPATFWGQHTASELPSSGARRVLVFDNGDSERAYSRALELEIDPATGTARVVWEFAPANGNHSFLVGLARRLTNGNTFVAFGAGPGVGNSVGPVEAYEVEPDGSVAWRVQVVGHDVEQNFIMYRAWPTGSLAGETRIER